MPVMPSYYHMYRRTERPKINDCPKSEAWFGVARHRWQWSATWNGNERRVLPFWSGTRGISRAGWRCFCCGKIEWDQSDDEFALAFAFRMGLIKYPPTVARD